MKYDEITISSLYATKYARAKLQRPLLPEP